jgi:hypothetical protein
VLSSRHGPHQRRTPRAAESPRHPGADARAPAAAHRRGGQDLARRPAGRACEEPVNLFLRDKHRRYWLFTTLEDARVDLKALSQRLDAGRFSFASAEALQELLGIAPGAVSPLAAVNDSDGQVTVVLDQALLALSPLNLHPLRNDRTTAIDPDDLVQFLEAYGHKPRLLTL